MRSKKCLRVDAQVTHYARLGNASALRTAQAYILISMPTGSSTIFGAFQDMSSFLLVCRATTALTFSIDQARIVLDLLRPT